MGTIILIISVLLITGLYFLLKFLNNVQPSGVEVKKDLILLKEKVAGFRGGLAPLEAGISTSDIDQILEKGKSRVGSGALMSSLGEPVVAYAYKKYIGPVQDAVLYVLTSEDEYVFRLTMRGTEIKKNGERVGLLKRNGQFVDTKNQEVGQVKRQMANDTSKILIGNQEVAKIALPNSLSGIEAIEREKISLSSLEEEQLTCLSVLELVSAVGELNK